MNVFRRNSRLFNIRIAWTLAAALGLFFSGETWAGNRGIVRPRTVLKSKAANRGKRTYSADTIRAGFDTHRLQVTRKCYLGTRGDGNDGYIKYTFSGSSGGTSSPDLELVAGGRLLLKKDKGPVKLVIEIPAAERHGILAEHLDKAVTAATSPGPYKKNDRFRMSFQLSRRIGVTVEAGRLCTIEMNLRNRENRRLVRGCSFSR